MHIKKSSHLKSRKIMNTIIILNVIIIVSRVTFNLMCIFYIIRNSNMSVH